MIGSGQRSCESATVPRFVASEPLSVRSSAGEETSRVHSKAGMSVRQDQLFPGNDLSRLDCRGFSSLAREKGRPPVTYRARAGISLAKHGRARSIPVDVLVAPLP